MVGKQTCKCESFATIKQEYVKGINIVTQTLHFTILFAAFMVAAWAASFAVI